MGTGNPSKKSGNGVTKIEFTIQNTVFLAVVLCFLGIVASVLVQIFYEPIWVNKIINRDLLVLYGGGTVQTYLEEKEIQTSANLIIIPAPSTSACNSLGDDVFVRNMIGKIIIMSSKKVQEEDFIANKNTHGKEASHILEIDIGADDTFYIHTTDKSIGDKYKNSGLKPDELRKLLQENPTDLKIYLTDNQSGTWAEYSKLTNKLVDSIHHEKYDRYTSFVDKDSFIILTRTNYDPIKKNKKTIKPHYTIQVKNENGSDKIGSLYFYIPVFFEPGTGRIKEFPIIDKFLSQRLHIEIDYSKIENQDALVIRHNKNYYK